MMSGGGVGSLVDETEASWMSPGNNLMDPKGYVDIDLQDVYYVDSVEIINDNSTPGSMDFSIAGSLIHVDLTKFRSIKGFNDKRAEFPIGAETKVLRIQFEASEKQRFNPLAGTYFIVGMEEVRVYGGLIKPAGLKVDYKKRELVFDRTASVGAVLEGVKPLPEVSLTIIDGINGQPVKDVTAIPKESMRLVASFMRDGGVLREVYALKRSH